MNNQIEKRDGIIVIGMISSGKSTFLNSLLGITYLEANDNITTKMVTAIRYNPDLTEPKFYHLKIIEKENEYSFERDGDEFIGKENIIKAISEMNKKEASNQPKYENLFYMLETNILTIENKEFLLHHDFYRISNEDMKYISGIFKYIKNIIVREIFIVSAETYYKPQNLQIIKEIRNQLNVPIENNLLILTKIDKYPNKEELIEKFYDFYLNNIEANIFNISYNTFVPINSKQFRNEMLMKENFDCYFLYFFNKYEEDIIAKDANKQGNKKSFCEYVSEYMIKGKQQDEAFDYLEEIASNVENKELEKIKNLIENIRSSSNAVINFGIDFDDEDDNSNTIMKAFYGFFVDKINFPDLSENVKQILNYFNDFKEVIEEKKEEKKEEEISPEIKGISMLSSIFEKLKKYVDQENDKENIINILDANIRIMEKFILNERKIYIPFIGVSSSGKSTVLNGILGYQLFPEDMNECTTRGIIIQYSDKAQLYESIIDDETKYYYIFTEKERPVAEGIYQVRKYLKGLNSRYAKDERKFFYFVKTPIRFFEDMEMSEELKQKILFVDLPGSDTKDNAFNDKSNENERTPYEKLLNISTSFVYINKGRAVKDNANREILKNLYLNIQDNSQLIGEEYLKSCLFVVNMFTQLSDEEKDINGISEDISTILFDNDSKKNQIKSAIFNAKHYFEYLRESTLLQDIQSLFMICKDEFTNQLSSSSLMKENNYVKFCSKKIKNTLNSLSLKYDNSIKCNEEYNSAVKIHISKNLKELKKELKKSDEKTINEMANVLYQANQNLKGMSFYQNSYCEGFFQNLNEQIIRSEKYKNKDYIERLHDSFVKFDRLFKLDIKKGTSQNKKEFQEKRNELKTILGKICNNENYFDDPLLNVFYETKRNILSYFDNKKSEIKELLEKKKNINNVEKEINEKIGNELEAFKTKFNAAFKEFIDNVETCFSKVTNILNELYKKSDTIISLKYAKDKEDLIKNDYNSLKTNFVQEIESTNQNTFFENFIGFFKNMFNIFNIFGSKEKEVNDKIDGIKKSFFEKFDEKKRIFRLKLYELKEKIKDEFYEILSLDFSDLSKIELQDWEESKKEYYKAKNLLLPNESKNEENKEETKEEESKEKRKEEETKKEETKKE